MGGRCTGSAQHGLAFHDLEPDSLWKGAAPISSPERARMGTCVVRKCTAASVRPALAYRSAARGRGAEDGKLCSRRRPALAGRDCTLLWGDRTPSARVDLLVTRAFAMRTLPSMPRPTAFVALYLGVLTAACTPVASSTDPYSAQLDESRRLVSTVQVERLEGTRTASEVHEPAPALERESPRVRRVFDEALPWSVNDFDESAGSDGDRGQGDSGSEGAPPMDASEGDDGGGEDSPASDVADDVELSSDPVPESSVGSDD